MPSEKWHYLFFCFLRPTITTSDGLILLKITIFATSFIDILGFTKATAENKGVCQVVG